MNLKICWTLPLVWVDCFYQLLQFHTDNAAILRLFFTCKILWDVNKWFHLNLHIVSATDSRKWSTAQYIQLQAVRIKINKFPWWQNSSLFFTLFLFLLMLNVIHMILSADPNRNSSLHVLNLHEQISSLDIGQRGGIMFNI